MTTRTETLSTVAVPSVENKQGKSWGWVMAAGISAIFLGALALVGPFFFGMGVTIFLSALLLVNGVVQVVNAIKFRKQPGFGITLFSGILSAIAGGILWANPLAGLITIGAFITMYFVFSGLFRMVMSFEMKPVKGWGWIFFGGLVTTLLGVYLFMQLPLAGMWLLGVVVGIDLIFLGTGQVGLSLKVKEFESQTAE